MSEQDNPEHMAAEPAVETEAASQELVGPTEAETTEEVDAHVAEQDSEKAEDEIAEQDSEEVEPVGGKRRINWSRVLAYGVLPGTALLLAMAAGLLKGLDSFARDAETAGAESVTAAKDSTIALLSYQPDTVDATVAAARDRLTAGFRDTYTKLTHDVVIPGAKQQHVSVSVTVPAAASVSATPQHAVALLFVNQSAVVGTDPPTTTVSSIRVTLQKISGHWLISGFDPI
jgi:Mce-associated membrane protein